MDAEQLEAYHRSVVMNMDTPEVADARLKYGVFLDTETTNGYIGMGVNVVYTGSIGDGSVIGAGSVVVKEIPPYSVAIGIPAKVTKKREK